MRSGLVLWLRLRLVLGLQWYANNSGCRVCRINCINSNRGVQILVFGL